MDFDYENEKKKPHCPVVDVDGFIANGKQFDLDITLPTDNRDVIFGVIRNCFKEPVDNAVVKLIEIEHKMGKEERKPVSHTFTDKDGEFVFGPLCPGKEYAIQIWVDDVKHVKICAKTFREGKCLKGVKSEKCDHDLTHGDKHYDNECKYKKYDKPHYDENYKDKDYEKPHYDEDFKEKNHNKPDYDEDYKEKSYDKLDYDKDRKDEKHDMPHKECKCPDHDEYPHKDFDKNDDKKE